MFRRLPSILTTALTVLLCGACVHAAAAQDYPRLGLYGSVAGDGTPFVKGDGSLDTTAIAQVARYDEVILDVNPLTPYRPDIAAALRARNPDIRLLAYVLGHDIWPAADADSLNHYPTRYRRLVRDLDGFLYNRLNGEHYPGANVNLARRDANGRFIVAEGLADLMYDAIVSTGQWDGVFFDVYCYTISWSQDGTQQIDYARAGYPSLAAFESAWQAGSDTLANRLRRLSGPSVILAGNCAGSAHQTVFNGWMRENFPLQNGGTWYDNMLSEPHGYFADEASFVQPAHNWIFSAVLGAEGSQYTAENARRVRFGLASAALGGGYGVFGPSDRNVRTAPYQAWWYDEYAVDRATGQSSDEPSAHRLARTAARCALPDDLGRHERGRGHERGLRNGRDDGLDLRTVLARGRDRDARREHVRGGRGFRARLDHHGEHGGLARQPHDHVEHPHDAGAQLLGHVLGEGFVAARHADRREPRGRGLARLAQRHDRNRVDALPGHPAAERIGEREPRLLPGHAGRRRVVRRRALPAGRRPISGGGTSSTAPCS
ncbi:MAG: hypothetical protein IPJ04_10610 [Candidatus Eisenbacteria bacterium]|nr:hypothetical protein [Candidatus Eisenbacteria bacterium]